MDLQFHSILRNWPSGTTCCNACNECDEAWLSRLVDQTHVSELIAPEPGDCTEILGQHVPQQLCSELTDCAAAVNQLVFAMGPRQLQSFLTKQVATFIKVAIKSFHLVPFPLGMSAQRCDDRHPFWKTGRRCTESNFCAHGMRLLLPLRRFQLRLLRSSTLMKKCGTTDR